MAAPARAFCAQPRLQQIRTCVHVPRDFNTYGSPPGCYDPVSVFEGRAIRRRGAAYAHYNVLGSAFCSLEGLGSRLAEARK